MMLESMNEIKVNKLKTGILLFEENERKFPNRHKVIHKGCCKNCPTEKNQKGGVIDSESEDIKTYPKEVISNEFLFVCAWRPNKLCKGICDFYDINQEYLDEKVSKESIFLLKSPKT